jgi:hypothetical protein
MPLACVNSSKPNLNWLSKPNVRPKNTEQAPSKPYKDEFALYSCTIQPKICVAGWLQPEDSPWSPPTYIYLETRGNQADYILQSPILRRPSTQEPSRFDPPYVHRPLNLRLLAHQASVQTSRGTKAKVYAQDGSTFSPGWKEMRRYCNASS